MITVIKTALPILTVIGQILSVLLVVFLALKPTHPYRQKMSPFIDRYALPLALVVALVATLGSLFYSEIAGYTPCKLCWYQRIFMYPQVILFGVALWKKTNSVWLYSLPLSILGGILALYHYYLQLGGNPLIPCTTVGYSVSCSQRFVMEYGYITIPIMALTGFVLLILLAVSIMRKKGG